MSQHDYVIDNAPGVTVRADINSALAAIVSQNSGATEPSTKFAYQWWADTTTGLLKIRNAANSAWVTLGTLAAANLGLLPLSGGTITGLLALNSAAINEAKWTDIASATTTDLGAANGNYGDVTGTTTITGLGTIQAGTERTVTFTGILTLTHNATSLILPTAANITTAAGDTAIFRSRGSGNWKCVNYTRADGTALSASVSTTVSAIRQTVSAGPVDTAGLPTFLPSTSANLNITSQNISSSAPFAVTAAGGSSNSTGYASDTIGVSTSNLTWTGCTASNTNYLPVSISGGVITTVTPVILAPIYQMGGTPSVTNGQYTFNISQMTMYKGNGTTAPAVNHVIVGEVVAGASTITSTIAYAYQGIYSPAAVSLPAASSATVFNDNIGTTAKRVTAKMINVTAEAGYTAGEEINYWSDYYAGYNADIAAAKLTRNTTTKLRSNGSGGALAIINASTFAAFNSITPANWSFKIDVRRGF
jgi:hypothetical protein